jgi:hypothetical protein
LFSILRLDWLAANAAYLSCTQADGFDCHGCTKADFFTYYPVKWVFYTGNPHLAAANSAIYLKLCSSFSLVSI